MATVHVRNVPDDLHKLLRERARAEGRSLSAELIALLDIELRCPAVDQNRLLAELDRLRQRHGHLHPDGPTTTEMIREDRDR